MWKERIENEPRTIKEWANYFTRMVHYTNRNTTWANIPPELERQYHYGADTLAARIMARGRSPLSTGFVVVDLETTFTSANEPSEIRSIGYVEVPPGFPEIRSVKDYLLAPNKWEVKEIPIKVKDVPQLRLALKGKDISVWRKYFANLDDVEDLDESRMERLVKGMHPLMDQPLRFRRELKEAKDVIKKLYDDTVAKGKPIATFNTAFDIGQLKRIDDRFASIPEGKLYDIMKWARARLGAEMVDADEIHQRLVSKDPRLKILDIKSFVGDPKLYPLQRHAMAGYSVDSLMKALTENPNFVEAHEAGADAAIEAKLGVVLANKTVSLGIAPEQFIEAHYLHQTQEKIKDIMKTAHSENRGQDAAAFYSTMLEQYKNLEKDLKKRIEENVTNGTYSRLAARHSKKLFARMPRSPYVVAMSIGLGIASLLTMSHRLNEPFISLDILKKDSDDTEGRRHWMTDFGSKARHSTQTKENVAAIAKGAARRAQQKMMDSNVRAHQAADAVGEARRAGQVVGQVTEAGRMVTESRAGRPELVDPAAVLDTSPEKLGQWYASIENNPTFIANDKVLHGNIRIGAEKILGKSSIRDSFLMTDSEGMLVDTKEFLSPTRTRDIHTEITSRLTDSDAAVPGRTDGFKRIPALGLGVISRTTKRQMKTLTDFYRGRMDRYRTTRDLSQSISTAAIQDIPYKHVSNISLSPLRREAKGLTIKTAADLTELGDIGLVRGTYKHLLSPENVTDVPRNVSVALTEFVAPARLFPYRPGILPAKGLQGKEHFTTVYLDRSEKNMKSDADKIILRQNITGKRMLEARDEMRNPDVIPKPPDFHESPWDVTDTYAGGKAWIESTRGLGGIKRARTVGLVQTLRKISKQDYKYPRAGKYDYLYALSGW